MTKLEGLLLKFVEHMKAAGFSERTVPDYAHNVRLFLDYLAELGIENIAEADRQILADYQARVLLQAHRGKALSPSTRKARLTCVRTFYRYLLKAGIVLYDPAEDLDLPKRPKTLPRNILTKKEIGQLLSAPDLEKPLGLRDRAIIEVFYATGIRVSELCDLTLQDIDLSAGELRINQGKNKKDRLVPLGEIACDFLSLYLHEARPKLADSSQAALFVTKNGRPFCRTNMSFLISRYGRKAGLKKGSSPHALRHTCATHLLKGKADIRQIQELLGHASVATTQRYTQVEIGDLKKVLKRCHPRERKEIEAKDV